MMRRAAPLAFVLVLALSARASAHLVPMPGDLAFVGIQSGGGTSAFAFVTLVDFTAREVVSITDRGWLASGGFRTGEDDIRWVPVTGVASGTVVTFSDAGGLLIDPRADQLFAYEGVIFADGSFTGTLMSAIQLGGPWQSDATSATTSALPPPLSGHEVALGSFLSCAYTGPTSGTRAELRALLGDPARWTCSDTTPPPFPAAFTVYSAQGETCTSDAQCVAGLYCAYGVCCDTACRRDEAFHCETCNFGLGDPRNGTCGPAPTTQLCRLGRGACDPMDQCDGVSRECPPNALSPAGSVCRASRGECDPEEVCSGSSVDCPADAIDPFGEVCRASRGECDPEERCDGGTACPSDAVLSDGTVCDDGLSCTAASFCAAGSCAGTAPEECDDGDPCTADGCDDAAGCTHAPIEGCCVSDASCDDGDDCTIDVCEASLCASTPIEGCGVDAGTDAGWTGADMDGGIGETDAGTSPPPGGCGCSTPERGGPLAHAWPLVPLMLARVRRRGRGRRERAPRERG